MSNFEQDSQISPATFKAGNWNYAPTPGKDKLYLCCINEDVTGHAQVDSAAYNREERNV